MASVSQRSHKYLMESDAEGKRLELKTEKEAVKRQAAWAGIGTGMRVLDVGCGVGVTTAALAELVGESGHVTGVDFSAERLTYAKDKYSSDNIAFLQHDIRFPLVTEEPYDAVWSRFFLEYFRNEQREVIRNSIASLRPGGLACLADLDNNSLGHYGLSPRMENAFRQIATYLENNHDFDPYAGRRLYGHLCELGFREIACTAEMHHLICGVSSEVDYFNWMAKVDVAAKQSGYQFAEFEEGFNGFRAEFEAFLNDPKRFTYTPIIIARGVKP